MATISTSTHDQGPLTPYVTQHQLNRGIPDDDGEYQVAVNTGNGQYSARTHYYVTADEARTIAHAWQHVANQLDAMNAALDTEPALDFTEPF